MDSTKPNGNNNSNNNIEPHCDPRDFPGVDVYAVVGNPIAHSKSPRIHSLFAQQTGQNIHYGKLWSPVDQFKKTVNDFFANGGKGLNITVPFKTQAYELSEQLTDRARAAGVVNVLWVEDGKLHGDNSDGVGLVRDLLRSKVALKNKKILMLGAGGAAQGVLLPLMAHQPEMIIVANRTTEKAQVLVEKFQKPAKDNNVQLQAIGLNDLHQLGQVDVIINATASGLSALSPLTDDQVKVLVKKTSVGYDMLYGQQTPFMKQIADADCEVFDGLGMLVEQAAEAFEIWRSNAVVGRLDTDVVIKALRRI